MNQISHHTDQELIASLGRGDRKAFETIYRRYAGDLYKYARRNISLKEDCEEIIQDIFESLWKRRDELGHVKALNAYLYRMVKYKVVRYFQNSLMRNRYADHYALFEMVHDCIPEHDDDPEVKRRMIDKGISKLPERCQTVLKLRLYENLSNSEIAIRMDITKKTVEGYMYRAFDHLRKHHPELVKNG